MPTTTITVPLSKLEPGRKAPGGSINSRKAEAPIEGLTASIAAHGLLVPLLVRKGGNNGTYYVVDGNRRLAALHALGKDAAAAGVLCVEVPDEGNALELSAVVNVDRAELHPVDRFEVFAALVQAGQTVEALAKTYRMKVGEVRQALALARMAPEVRDAWRAGKISDEAAEAFTVTADHKAQAAVLKRAGNGSAWNIRSALTKGEDDVGRMLKFVGRAVYEKAGYAVNEMLFSDRDDDVSVSDVGALRALAERKLSEECDKLTTAGWKWAVIVSDAPKDWQSWRRVYETSYTKAAMAGLGCVVSVGHDCKVRVERGVAKPGDKVATPKAKASPKEKAAADKAREQRKEETGGISNALAQRLSAQLTAAVRDALPGGMSHHEAVALAIAVLACENEATPHVRLSAHGFDEDGDGRDENDFAKYHKLALGKSVREQADMLLTWVAKAVDLKSRDGGRLNQVLHPDKDGDRAGLLIAKAIDPKRLKASMQKHFDASDYFASVSKEMIFQAVDEALGSEHSARVAKMKAAEAKEYAIKHVPRTGWVPSFFRA
jgi:ParB family chromosome partitioning protein